MTMSVAYSGETSSWNIALALLDAIEKNDLADGFLMAIAKENADNEDRVAFNVPVSAFATAYLCASGEMTYDGSSPFIADMIAATSH